MAKFLHKAILAQNDCLTIFDILRKLTESANISFVDDVSALYFNTQSRLPWSFDHQVHFYVVDRADKRKPIVWLKIAPQPNKFQ